MADEVTHDSPAANRHEFSCGDGVEDAHPPTSGGGGGSIPTSPLVLFDLSAVYTDSFMERGTTWRRASVEEVNGLLAEHHYLGPLKSGGKLIFAGTVDDEIVACQIWRHPTSRRLPQDGTWLELSRWCLTPNAGISAGSRMHKYVARWIKANCPEVTTLVSYSDPSQGHTGALYRSCNWYWAPTWLRLRPPPSGNGAWSGNRQQVKDRWIFDVRPDLRRAEIIRVKDDAIVKRLEAERASAEEAA